MNANENDGKFVLDNLVLKFKCYIINYKENQNYQDWNVFKANFDANFGGSKMNLKKYIGIRSGLQSYKGLSKLSGYNV